MPLNPGGSALKDGKIPAMDTATDAANPPFPKQIHALQWGLLDAATDGGDGSGIPERHNVENLPDIKSNLGNVAEDKKRFTEGLHNRRANGTFEPSSERGLTRRKKIEEEIENPDEEDLMRR